jgi:hypothetical protein
MKNYNYFTLRAKKAHPAADWQGAQDKLSVNLKKARGAVVFLSVYFTGKLSGD